MASGLHTPVQPRVEGSLDALRLLNNARPVGLFNRYDLHDPSGADCGEFRIVYSLSPGPFFIIFEARIPNPDPSEGLRGCLDVARLCQTVPDLGVSAQAAALEAFYFDGENAVVRFENFRGSRGQVRTNTSVGSPWQLREFRTQVRDGVAVLAPDTVKDAALAQFYNKAFEPSDDSPLRLSEGSLDFSQLRVAFQNEFVGSMFDRLTAPERGGETDPQRILNDFGIGVPHRFLEFQSDAALSDAVGPNTDRPLRDAVAQKLVESGLDSQLSVDHILNRANAMTCGGCHNTAAGREIAPGLRWPRSLGFSQISATGSLSAALTQVFLPARAQILEDFLCTQDNACTSDSDCDDALFCNGEESCDASLGCVPGGAPCADDSCDEVADRCMPSSVTLGARSFCLDMVNWNGQSHTESDTCSVGGYIRHHSIPYDNEMLADFDTSELGGTLLAATLTFRVSTSDGVDTIRVVPQDKGPYEASTVNYDSFPYTAWGAELGSTQGTEHTRHRLSTEALRETVQAWIDGETPNHGLVLVAEPWYWGYAAEVSELELELEFRTAE
ncbi:MAG: DNRLRE domain-containing protein [Nannocystaceae bacterium]